MKGDGYIYKVEHSDAIITAVLVENKPCVITLKAPEGAPQVKIEKSKSSYSWWGEEITDLTNVEVGTKIRIYYPTESKDWVLNKISVDGKTDLPVGADYNGKYIEYTISKSIEIETSFIKGIELKFAIKPTFSAGVTYFDAIWVQDATSHVELNNLALRKNTKLQICMMPTAEYKVDKVVPVKDLEEQTPLELKEGSYKDADGQTVTYTYAELQLAEEDGIIYLYLSKKGEEPNEESFEVKVEDIDDEPAEAGCEVTLAPEADEEGKYNVGQQVTILITEKGGYKLDKVMLGTELLKRNSDGALSFVVKEDATLTATFIKEVKKFSVKVAEIDAKAAAAGCKVVVTPVALTEGVYEEGMELTATITLGKGYKSATLTANEGIQLTKKSDLVYTFKVTKNVVLTAKFEATNALEETQAVAVRVYPNPASEYVVVESAEAFSTLVLYSLDGVEVLRTQSDAAGRARLEVASLPSGEYLIYMGQRTERIIVR